MILPIWKQMLPILTYRRKAKKEEESLEVKLGVGYAGKEARYSSGKSKRLKEKFVLASIGVHGQEFMERLSLLAEERLSLSKAKKILFGGDGDSWIISGVGDYFPSATYLLCFYHLFKRLRECLGRRKEEQKTIKDLLLSNQTDKALSKIEQMIRAPYDLKEKDNLTKLYTYITRNHQGIANQVILKDQEIQRTGAIESNINKVIASRFKKRGMVFPR